MAIWSPKEMLLVFLRSLQAREIASKLFDLQHVIEVQLHQDRQGLFVRTSNADDFFLAFNRRARFTSVAQATGSDHWQ
jgi:hypothetical protein